MPYCENCGTEIGFLPFKCKYCGGIFCKKHRLPENHECSFELKHSPVVPTSTRIDRTKYQDYKPIETPLSQDSYTSQAKDVKKYLKRQEKRQKRIAKRARTGIDYRRSPSYTIYLFLAIFITSIVGLFIPQFIGFSIAGIVSFYFWTLITSLFFVNDGFLGLIFLFIFFIFFIYIGKMLDLAYGRKFIIKLYVVCAVFTGFTFVLLRFLIIPLVPLNIAIPFGFATGGLLGIFAFIIYPNYNKQMTFFMYFLPIRLKGKYILLVLVLFRLAPAVFFYLFTFNVVYFILYLPDLGGLVGAYLVFYNKARF